MQISQVIKHAMHTNIAFFDHLYLQEQNFIIIIIRFV